MCCKIGNTIQIYWSSSNSDTTQKCSREKNACKDFPQCQRKSAIKDVLTLRLICSVKIVGANDLVPLGCWLLTSLQTAGVKGICRHAVGVGLYWSRMKGGVWETMGLQTWQLYLIYLMPGLAMAELGVKAFRRFRTLDNCTYAHQHARICTHTHAHTHTHARTHTTSTLHLPLD
jgi:hypothetical protein